MDKRIQSLGASALAARGAILFAVLAVLPAGAARAGLVSLDFNFDTTATQTGAALIGSAGDQWNGIDLSSTPNPHALITTTGAASGVSVTDVSMGSIGPFGPPTPFVSTPFNALMQDGARAFPPASLTFSGLAPNQPYDLYFYAQDSAGFAGTTTFTINGTPKTVSFDGSTNTFIEGVTYGHFTSAVASGTGTMAISITGTGSFSGVVNGLQLNTVPEPAGLGTLAALAAIGTRRRRRTETAPRRG